MIELVNDQDFWKEIEIEQVKRKSRAKKLHPLQKEGTLYKLLNGLSLQKPKINSVYSSVYNGVVGSFYSFGVEGFKDEVKVEIRPGESKYLKNTQIGDVIDVLVTDIDDSNFFIRGSISTIYESKAHESLKSLEEDSVVMAYVRSINPAGYDLDIFYEGITLPGFMPNTLAGINKLHDPEYIVGQTFEVMIESYSNQEGTYIASRRRYLKTLIPDAIEALDRTTVYSGFVTGTTPFGVFVEFNECLTGMIHKVNINPEWQEKLNEIKPGFQIEFYVKEIVKDKIILTQILRESLWDNIRVGQNIDGRVKDVKNFGVLVQLDDETMGLIHNSEVEKTGKKFTKDSDIKVKVLAIDRQNRKIFLTGV